MNAENPELVVFQR